MATTPDNTPRRNRGPIIDPNYNFGSVTDKISSIVLAPGTHAGWWIGFGLSFLLMMVLFWSIAVLFCSSCGRTGAPRLIVLPRR
jgi:hypothetical protein